VDYLGPDLIRYELREGSRAERFCDRSRLPVSMICAVLGVTLHIVFLIRRLTVG